MLGCLDDFSRDAANAMLANIYGYQFNPCYEDVCFRFFSARTTSKVSFTLSREQRKAVFSFRAYEEKLQLPKIHLVINNRVSEYQLRLTMFNVQCTGFSKQYL